MVSELSLGRGTYPLVLPNIRDPRLHVAAVIITIHVLGQVGLHFTVSVWQILAAILTCALLELVITFAHKRAIVWPASAMLTGSGIGLILRVVGTPPDDHWSTYAIGVFAAVAACSLLSKYLIRYRGSPLFNPSNVGLVVTFILLGTSRVEPLDFWWGPPSAWLFAAYAVILSGGVLIARRLGLVGLALSFWVTLAIGLGLLAAAGHCVIANWAFAPVCGGDFWRVVLTSPEIFIFLFFMITDPRTVPTGRVSRIGFGMLVAAVGVLCLAPQTTEFGAKVGLLAGLTLVCLARPLLDHVLPKAIAFVPIGVVAISAAVVLAGAPARGVEPVEAAMSETDFSRMDPSTFPAISVDSAVTDWDPTLSGAAMQAVVLTAAQNLNLENQALLQANPDVLLQVDHGDRLEEMQKRIDESVASGAIRLDHYQLESVQVSLVRPFGKQDGLSLGLNARGTLTTETYDTSRRLQSRATSAFALTFVVRRATGARWLNVAVLPQDP